MPSGRSAKVKTVRLLPTPNASKERTNTTHREVVVCTGRLAKSSGREATKELAPARESFSVEGLCLRGPCRDKDGSNDAVREDRTAQPRERSVGSSEEADGGEGGGEFDEPPCDEELSAICRGRRSSTRTPVLERNSTLPSYLIKGPS